jgi:hypothetical protein
MQLLRLAMRATTIPGVALISGSRDTAAIPRTAPRPPPGVAGFTETASKTGVSVDCAQRAVAASRSRTGFIR